MVHNMDQLDHIKGRYMWGWDAVNIRNAYMVQKLAALRRVSSHGGAPLVCIVDRSGGSELSHLLAFVPALA